jgi:dihydroorotate dehydrogenase electron transfer subunit
MGPAHARLLCQVAFEARERGLDVWAGARCRDALRACRLGIRLLEDAEIERRSHGLARQVRHVGMLWLDGERVVCRLESITAGAPPAGFPGPERVRCLVIVDRPEQANPPRRKGWAAVLSRDLARYLRRAPLMQPRSRPAREGRARVAAIEPRGQGAFRITLSCLWAAEAARPGQFVLLECVASAEGDAFRRAGNRIWHGGEGLSVDPKLPLLRRPFGLHRFSGPDYDADRLREQPPFSRELLAIIEPGRGATFDLLFKVVGVGTQRLAQMRVGETLSLRAPLGRPIEIRSDLDCAVLVGGGIGAGPLFAVAQELRRQGRSVHALLGARSAEDAPVPPEHFEHIGAHAVLVTEQEDGLLVTQHLQRHLPQMTAGVTEVFACGPRDMLAEVARIASPAIPVQVLMEQRMACGMGVCRGCVVRMRAAGERLSYRTVCRDGPAFRAEEVAWEELPATVG